ncbi:Transposase, Ptta/En/Spm, plant [Corchorus olitorius]|uniref:Transposase, Ptta/En/Spm, plant n=1 Tax=Corchorus olitorius TaxID=93759 RepID=A0A1R3KJI5_9ROSI|nr:Transposase, Ptta/En/Spm, plant [Corchorus olitorius]
MAEALVIGFVIGMRNKQSMKHRNHKMMNKNLWILLQSKFEFVPYKDESDEEITAEILEEQLEVAKSWVLKNISGKRRQWKNYLKSTGFDPSKTIDEMVEEITDSRVDKQQYKKIVEYWCSDKAKEISTINQANRLKLDEPHCTGTKLFARIMEEKAAADANSVPNASPHAHRSSNSSIQPEGYTVAE